MISDNKNIFYHFKRFLYAVLPRKTADNTRIICKNCASIFINYIIGKSFDSIIVMIICFIIMLILKLPYAVLISVIVGITNMIPYFGPYIGGVIGGVIIVIASPIKLIIFVIMIVCIQQVDGLLIGPRIIGSTTGLKPVWVVFSKEKSPCSLMTRPMTSRLFFGIKNSHDIVEGILKSYHSVIRTFMHIHHF